MAAITTTATQISNPYPDNDAPLELQGGPKGTPNPKEEVSKDHEMEGEDEVAKESQHNGDLPDYILMDMDRMMDAMYGNHLMGGVSDNAF